jgi:hypothetical protein
MSCVVVNEASSELQKPFMNRAPVEAAREQLSRKGMDCVHSSRNVALVSRPRFLTTCVTICWAQIVEQSQTDGVL